MSQDFRPLFIYKKNCPWAAYEQLKQICENFRFHEDIFKIRMTTRTREFRTFAIEYLRENDKICETV